MKKLFLLFLFSHFFVNAQYKSGEELLRTMHKKYYNKYCRTVQFDQKTTRFDSTGNAKDTSRWFEWISYPDKFRIDFGTKHGGNCVIFKNDSSFRYKGNKLIGINKDENELLLLLGGMYFRKFEAVKARLKKVGYNLAPFASVKEGEKLFYIIGAAKKDVPRNDQYQIWIDPADLKVVRIKTQLGSNDWIEMNFDGFQKSCGGFTETKVTATKNGKPEQQEEYLNLKTGIIIPDSIFTK